MDGQRKRARRAQKGGDAVQDAVVEFARATRSSDGVPGL